MIRPFPSADQKTSTLSPQRCRLAVDRTTAACITVGYQSALDELTSKETHPHIPYAQSIFAECREKVTSSARAQSYDRGLFQRRWNEQTSRGICRPVHDPSWQISTLPSYYFSNSVVKQSQDVHRETYLSTGQSRLSVWPR